MIDSTIHETVAVGRADNRIDDQVDDRAAMNRYIGQVAAMSFPRIREFFFDSRKNDLQGSSSLPAC